MKISEKSWLSLTWFSIFCCFAILLFLSLCSSCSSSRKNNSDLSMASESVALESEDSVSISRFLNVSSGLNLNVSIDSVKFFHPRMLAEMENPPDPKMTDLPLAAAAYGINMTAASSDSLVSSSKTVSGSKSSATADSSKASKLEKSQEKSDGGKSCTVGIIVFIFLILASIMAMRYLDRK